DILDIAQKFADKIEEIANDPAGSVQELNNIIAAALGKQMATLDITPSGSHNLTQTIAIDHAIAGKFKLTFKNATTTSIAFDASADDVRKALEALKTIGKGNVAVTIVSGHYRVAFQGKFASPTTDLPLLVAGPLVINTPTQGNAVDEIQTINVRSGSTGTFKLHYTTGTGNLNPGISAADMQSALEVVAGAGNVTVTSEDVFGGTLYTVTFGSGLAHTNVAQITANVTNITAGGVAVATKRDGSGADECATVNA